MVMSESVHCLVRLSMFGLCVLCCVSAQVLMLLQSSGRGRPIIMTARRTSMLVYLLLLCVRVRVRVRVCVRRLAANELC